MRNDPKLIQLTEYLSEDSYLRIKCIEINANVERPLFALKIVLTMGKQIRVHVLLPAYANGQRITFCRANG